MAEHTKGPWEHVPFSDPVGMAGADVFPFSVRSEDWAIAEVYGDAAQLRPQAEANARLIARAPDHAAIGWAMCVQDGTWEEWVPYTGAGEFCFAGLRYATKLDEFGVPILTNALRAAIANAAGAA